ncbi:alpha/beta hydrolase [Parabacteroides sp. OttesenSCG-928-G07]|nr:alpha/beta hydrolase [Parabacteroides sp. OttesenSCG-928-G07]
MDKQEKIRINHIPAILYGSDSDKLYLYVHGKHSRKEEAEHFANIAEKAGYQVLSFDLPEHGELISEPYPCTVQNSVRDLKEVYSFIKNRYNTISLHACSIGAYFSLLAYRDIEFEKCLFLSPILDMERLIQNMMKWSNISEEELKEKGEHETSFGETLSWDYYEYVRNNPVSKWDNPTYILYGENDHLTERYVLDSFAMQHSCTVDIMAGGEHYFHTKEQLDYLENWLETVIKINTQ